MLAPPHSTPSRITNTAAIVVIALGSGVQEAESLLPEREQCVCLGLAMRLNVQYRDLFVRDSIILSSSTSSSKLHGCPYNMTSIEEREITLAIYYREY